MKILVKYIKISSALCLVFALMCPVFVPSATDSGIAFEDVKKSDWHYTYIKMLTDEGILKGMTPTSFEPSGKLTAAQLCALTVRYLGLEDEAEKLRLELTGDVWFSGYAGILYQNGILDGADFALEEKNGVLNFSAEALAKLNSPVSRSLTAKITARALDSAPHLVVGGGYDEISLKKALESLKDFEEIPQDMRSHVAKCCYNGIINGYEDATFRPDGLLTRAEGAKIVAVIMNPDLRVLSELRDLPPTAVMNESDFITDHNGNKRLTKQRLSDLLWQIGTGLSFSSESIELNLKNILPQPYTMGVQFYIKKDGAYQAVYDFADTALDFPVTLRQKASGERAVLIYLKNTCADGRIDAVYEIRADKNGKTTFSQYDIR